MVVAIVIFLSLGLSGDSARVQVPDNVINKDATQDVQINADAEKPNSTRVDVPPPGCTNWSKIYKNTQFGEEIGPMCQPALLDQWKKQAALNKKDPDNCHYDEKRGEIVCEMKKHCQGGEEATWQLGRVKSVATFQCDKCSNEAKGDVLRVPCCMACDDLKKKINTFWLTGGKSEPVRFQDKLVTSVMCEGCQEEKLTEILNQNPVICSRDKASGSFSCDIEDSCDTGKMKMVNHTEDFTCKVTPCDKCGDPVARAQCCSDCLQDACSGSEGKSVKVCTGCGVDSSSSWNVNLIIVSVGLFIFFSIQP